jgi:hypothetical protein
MISNIGAVRLVECGLKSAEAAGPFSPAVGLISLSIRSAGRKGISRLKLLHVCSCRLKVCTVQLQQNSAQPWPAEKPHSSSSMHCDIINRMFPTVLRFPDQCWKQLLNFLAQNHPIDHKLWFQTIELFHALWYQRNTISKSLFSSDITSTLTKYFIPGQWRTQLRNRARANLNHTVLVKKIKDLPIIKRKS